MKYFWDEKELADHWPLSFEVIELLRTKPSRSHLPFCVKLKYFKYLSLFPESFSEIHEVIMSYLKGQLEVVDIEEYKWDGSDLPQIISSFL